MSDSGHLKQFLEEASIKKILVDFAMEKCISYAIQDYRIRKKN